MYVIQTSNIILWQGEVKPVVDGSPIYYPDFLIMKMQVIEEVWPNPKRARQIVPTEMLVEWIEQI